MDTIDNSLLSDPTLEPQDPVKAQQPPPQSPPTLADAAALYVQETQPVQGPPADLQAGGPTIQEAASAYVADEENRRQIAANLDKQAFLVSLDSDPWAQRNAAIIAKDLGVDQQFAARNKDAVQKVYEARQYEMWRQAQGNDFWGSLLHNQLTDPNFMRQARDSVEPLWFYERFWNGLRAGELGARRGEVGFLIGAGIDVENNTRRLAQINADLEGLRGTDGIFGGFGGFLGGMARPVTYGLAGGFATAAAAGAAGITTGPLEAAVLPLGFASGFTGGFFGSMYAEMAGNSFADLVSKGVPQQRAAVTASIVGLANTMLMQVPLHAIGAPVQEMVRKAIGRGVGEALATPTISSAGTKFLKTYLGTVGTFGAIGAAQELVNVIGEGLNTGNWEHAPERVAEATKGAVEASLLMAFVPSFAAARNVALQAAISKANKEKFAAVVDRLNTSNLGKENPDAAGEFAAKVAAANGVDAVWIGGKEMQDVLQQRDAEIAAGGGHEEPALQQLDKLIPGLGKKVAEAARTGGDVAIPVDEFQSKLAGSPILGKMWDHIRLGENDLSRAETARINVDGLVDAATKALESEADYSAANKEHLQSLEKELTAQLQAAMPGMGLAEAKRQVKLWTLFVDQANQRTGISVERLRQRYPLSVRSGEAPPEPGASPVVDTLQSTEPGSYRGQHRAPGPQSGSPLSDLTGTYPEDVYSKDAARLYGFDATINPGDWVTVSRGYAEQHGEAALGGDYRIIEKQVRAGDVFTNGDSIHEAGYHPTDRNNPDVLLSSEPPRPGEVKLTEEERAAFKKQFAGRIKALAAMMDNLPDDEARALAETKSKGKAAAKVLASRRETMLEMAKALPSADEMAAVARAGRSKKGWYEWSMRAIDLIFGGDAARFAKFLAALSPQTSVEANLTLKSWAGWIAEGRPRDAKSIKRILGENVQGNKGEGSVLNSWIDNAVTALTEEDSNLTVLSGPKVDSFARNLLGAIWEVTNDAWMANYFGVDQGLFGNDNSVPLPGKGPGYIATSLRTREAAKLNGWSPAEIQETVWSFAKALYEGAKAAGMTAVDFLKAGKLTHELINATPDYEKLFLLPEYRGILEKAGYGKEIAALEKAVADRQDTPPYGPVFAPDSKDAPHLLEAAKRLDVLAAQRAFEESRAELVVNLSASTGKIPGIDKLQKAATAGDRQAHALLQEIAGDSLRHLLAGVKSAKVTMDPVTGLYFGSVEPSLQVRVSFREGDRARAMVALKQFARNFDQQQVHVRAETAKGSRVGTVHDDGSFNTRVYRFFLKEGSAALDDGTIHRIAQESGLAGFTAHGDHLEAYFVGDPHDEAALTKFEDAAVRAAESLGSHGSEARRSVERLWAYGDGFGSTHRYGDIAGEFHPAKTVEANRTAQRIATRLARREVVAAPPEKKVTPSQRAWQAQIAKNYDALKVNNMADPNVRRAYTELASEVADQFDALPIKVEVWTKKGEPYDSSDKMRKDVLNNNRLRILATSPDTFGPPGADFSGHPLLADSGRVDANGRKLLVNDLLRAVHDYYAHTSSLAEFGPLGEEAAWRTHMEMTRSPWARWALTTETRGQNSWVNFREGAEGKSLTERGFAVQKADLLPITNIVTGDKGLDASLRELPGGPDVVALTAEGPGILMQSEAKGERALPSTPEFRAWHGNSKVKEVVYHGGTADAVFDTERGGGGAAMFGRGAYFGGEGVAQEFVDIRGKGKVTAAYLALRHPFVEGEAGSMDPAMVETLRSKLVELGAMPHELDHLNKPWLGDLFHIISSVAKRRGERAWKFGERVGDAIRESGFDGIIAEYQDGKQYVAFRPEQIRSVEDVNKGLEPGIQAKEPSTPAPGSNSAKPTYSRKDATLTTVQVAPVKIGTRKIPLERVQTMDHAATVAADMAKSAVERFDAIVTDREGKVLSIVGGFKGATAEATVPMSTLISDIFAVKGGENVWFVHNHPSGNAELSGADVRLWNAIATHLDGSGVEAKGLLAIGSQVGDGPRKWSGVEGMSQQFTDKQSNGDVQPGNAASTSSVPLYERQIKKNAKMGEPIKGPADVPMAMQDISTKPGILFLDSRHQPITFVELGKDGENEQMRGTGRLQAMYRAISKTASSTAVIVASNVEGAMSANAVKNVGSALRNVRINVLDAVDVNGIHASSWNDRGAAIGHPDDRVYSTEPTQPGETPQEPKQPAPTPEEQTAAVERVVRGYFNTKDFSITLTKDANFSTFVHELGHAFLEVYARLAEEKVSPLILDDFGAFLRWAGFDSIDAWKKASPEDRRRAHENFARNWEDHMSRGEEPSPKLARLFAAFRQWIVGVYRGVVRGRLNAAHEAEFPGHQLLPLSPEIRAVMDRMVANEEDVATAAKVRGSVPMFESWEQAKAAGVTPAQWTAMQDARQAADDAAVAEIDRASLAEMQRLGKLKAKKMGELERRAKKRRDELRGSVAAEVQSQPVRRADRWLRTGEWVAEDGTRQQGEADANHRIRTADAEAAGVKLPDSYMRADGMPAEQVAKVFGFGSGDELLRALADAKPFEDVVEKALDERMMQDHPDLQDPARREDAVNRALHGEARRRFVAIELSHLVGGAGTPARVVLGAVKLAAQRALQDKQVGEIIPQTFTRAARRASIEASMASAKGDTRGALEAKRKQLLQEAMADIGYEARARIDEAKTDSRRLFGADKDLAKTRDIDLIYAGREVLAAFSLGLPAETPQEQQLRARALEYLRAEEPALAQRVGAHLAMASGGNPVNYRKMSLRDFQGLMQVVDDLWSTARKRKQLDLAGKKVEIDAAALELATQVLARGKRVAPGATAPTGETAGPVHATLLKGWDAVAGLKRVEFWCLHMDGGKPGPWTRLLWDPMNAAVERLSGAERQMIESYHDLMAKVRDAAGDAWLREIKATELDFTFKGKHELLGALLHAGTSSNLEKNLVGSGWGTLVDDGTGGKVLDTSRWDAFVKRMFDTGVLTKADTEFLRSVWGLYETYLPMAQKVHKAVFGHEYATLEHRVIPTPFGDLKGGYVPARVDPSRATKRITIDSLEDIEHRFQFSMGPARGFAIERNPNYRQPLTLDLSRQLGSLTEELRFIHTAEAGKNALRLIRHPEVQTVLQSYDRAVTNGLLMPWVENTVLQQTSRSSGYPILDAVFSFLRSATSMAYLGFNLVNSAIQITGVAQAQNYVEFGHQMSGLRSWFQNPFTAMRRVAAESPYMAERFDTQTQKMRRGVQHMLEGPIASGLGMTREAAQRGAFFLQRVVQGTADAITWLGAKAQAEARGATPEEAVRAGDAAVRLGQGSPRAIDMAPWEASTPFVKLFTQFGNFANVMLNQVMAAQPGWGRVRAVGWTILVPALVEGMIRSAIMGGPKPKDGSDGSAADWAAMFAGNVFRNLSGLLPGAGPALAALAESEGSRVSAPFVEVLKDGFRGAFAAEQWATGGTLTASEVRAIGSALTLLTGFPIAGPVRLVQQVTR